MRRYEPDVTAARRGDQDAFTRLYANNLTRVTACISRVLFREPEAVPDVVQNTFMKAFTRLRSFRGGSRFSSWVYRIAFNEAQMWLRKEKQGKPHEVSLDEPVSDENPALLANTLVYQDVSVTFAPERLTLVRAVASLAPRYRQVIRAVDLGGFMHQEAAKRAGITTGCAKSYRYRALRLLRERLEGTRA